MDWSSVRSTFSEAKRRQESWSGVCQLGFMELGFWEILQ